MKYSVWIKKKVNMVPNVSESYDHFSKEVVHTKKSELKCIEFSWKSWLLALLIARLSVVVDDIWTVLLILQSTTISKHIVRTCSEKKVSLHEKKSLCARNEFNRLWFVLCQFTAHMADCFLRAREVDNKLLELRVVRSACATILHTNECSWHLTC